ncbi:hypothetical protein [Vibrio mexicanus]|uniref:hypothetical protein n=1 Tax=Vibrio mexicanus TaxID=1004326 RepID=UPI00063CDC02|nr:hypothetical protein [Vibrio mexicanus]
MTITNQTKETGSIAESPMQYSVQPTAQHHWQSDGLSSYPPKDPLVGQSQFFNDFESFIHLVDKEDNHFTQVFSMVAEWGVVNLVWATSLLLKSMMQALVGSAVTKMGI